MTRYIDADALKKAMDGYWGRCQRIRKPRNGETAVFLDIKAIVEDCPTIDAVTVADIIEVEKERNYWHDLADSYERTILKLNNALQESVPVRHGKWVPKTIIIGGRDHVSGMKCSVCGEDPLNAEGDEFLTDYCPNCGARMDEEIEGRKK